MSVEEVLKIYNYAKKVVKKAGFDDYFIYINNLLGNSFNRHLTLQEFFKQYVWVVFTCGFNASIVRKNWDAIKHMLYDFNVRKVREMTVEKLSEKSPIKNRLKVSSIIKGSQIITNEWLDDIRFAKYSEEIKGKLIKLPHISDVTVYHLMRNIGIDCFKPDRHIINISSKINLDPNELFNIIIKTGREKYIGLADFILWKAASILSVDLLLQYAMNDKPLPKINFSNKNDNSDILL